MKTGLNLKNSLIFVWALIFSSVVRADITLLKGWNLVGNGQTGDITVASALNDVSKVTTVWKWNSATSRWAFYTPMQTDGGAAYALSKGYDTLTVIQPGEGFWVNAATASTVAVSGVSPFAASNFAKGGSNSLQTGWNLIAMGDTMTAEQFNASIAPATSSTQTIPINVTTLWAWDAQKSSWYFYAPNLQALGGNSLSSYITNKGYLDFTTNNKMLGDAVGFWVNVPDTSYTTVSSNVSASSSTSNLNTQIITMSAPSTWVLGTPVTVTLGTSSGLSATLSTTTSSVCTVNGSTVTLLTLGKCDLVASQSGNSKYLAASDLTQSFNVISDIPPLIPTISNISNLTMTVGDPTLAIGSTSSIQTSSEAAPIFSNGPVMVKVQDTSATVTWVTDKPSLSGISWSDSSSRGSQTETKLATNHAKLITGLKPNTSYQLFLTATDGKGNGPTISSTVSFTTTASTSSQAALPQASTMSNCDRSKNLIGANDTQGWNVLSLTTAPNRPACILAMQDAGKYIVVSVKDISDSNGLICDLVVIAKKTGATTCINVPLTYRSKTGNPEFYLGNENFAPGQLTPDGQYFTLGFATNGSGLYMGYLRLDFSSSTPTASIAYLLYSATPGSCNGIPTINGNNLFNSYFWMLPNGDLTITLFEPNGCDKPYAGPATGTRRYYFVRVNPVGDPLKPFMKLFAVNPATSSDAYTMDPVNSPLAAWALNLYPNVLAFGFGGATLPWANEALGVVSFYVGASSSGGIAGYSPTNTCVPQNSGVGSILVKVNVDTQKNLISFEDAGPTTLGNGAGLHPDTNNVILDVDGKSFTSLKWSLDGSSDSHIVVSTLKKPLDKNLCEGTTNVFTTSAKTPSALVQSVQGFPFTYSTDNHVFMLSFNSNPWAGMACLEKLGCPIDSDAMVLSYNKKTRLVQEVPLTPLNGAVQLYSFSTYTNPVNDELRTTLYDKAGNMYFANISNQGVRSNIKFPQGFSTTSGFVNFATPPSVP